MKLLLINLILLLSVIISKQDGDIIEWFKVQRKGIYVNSKGQFRAIKSGKINGEALKHSFPWQAALIINDTIFCGGSLITESYVLTAAQCTQFSDDKSIIVVLGAHDWQSEEHSQQYIRSSKVITHPDFSSTYENDIGLVELSTPAVLNANVQTVPLATYGNNNWNYQLAVLSGWGRDRDLKTTSLVLEKVFLATIPNSMCASYETYKSLIKSTNICTTGNVKKGGCFVESGGPLIVAGIQVGIVSFRSHTCTDRSPTVYTRVSKYISWIKSNSDL
ncbi:trypsin-like [Aethina tumida]|uniref:trypsin-like n=1 Tax=Aethina tumida TaxID=116153 RepID=UPI0021497B79|nr:trypsin-like [Aethina tumida]